MPVMDGLEATRQILKDNSETEVLILSMHESEQIVHDVLNCGARGYVLKSDAGTDLIKALEALRRHKVFFTSNVSEVVLRGYLNGSDADNTGATPATAITPREREIVQLVAEGNSNKEVASALNISVKTVETHRARIMAKLDLHSVGDLVRYAIRNSIVQA
jgi:DNA-binding NarL/FixJ family response regulator